MPLAATALFYKGTSKHNKRATARLCNELACCASAPETESAGARALSDTRCWLGDEGRGWHVAELARAKGAMPIAGVAPFHGTVTTGTTSRRHEALLQ